MKLLLSTTLLSASLLAETTTQVASTLPISPTQGNNGVVAGTAVWIYDTQVFPAWYGVDLRYKDEMGVEQKLWFVCSGPLFFVNDKWVTYCTVPGLKIQSGTATVLRSDGK